MVMKWMIGIAPRANGMISRGIFLFVAMISPTEIMVSAIINGVF